MENVSSYSQNHESHFWKKKTVLSYVLACLVLILHNKYSETYNCAKWIGDCVSLVAVPTFFFLSGLTFFRNFTPKVYFSKIKSRFWSLVVPYLLWNTIWYAFSAITSRFLPGAYHGRELADLSVSGLLKGIFFYSQNIPFWFIFDLIVFVVISPVIYWIIKDKYAGLLTIALIAVLTGLGIGLPESVFFSSDSIIYFLLGSYIGKHAFDRFISLKTEKTILGIVGVISCALLFTFVPQFRESDAIRMLILCCYSVSLIWAFDVFKYGMVRKFFYHSFWVYAMHLYTAILLSKALHLLFPDTLAASCFCTPLLFVLTLSLIEVVARFAERYLPAFSRLLSGGR